MTRHSEQSLREVKIFARENTIWGIPSKQFIGAGVFALLLLAQIPAPFALAIGALLYGVLFAIYNDDPRALVAWQRSIGRPTRWSICAQTAREVTVLPFRN